MSSLVERRHQSFCVLCGFPARDTLKREAAAHVGDGDDHATQRILASRIDDGKVWTKIAKDRAIRLPLNAGIDTAWANGPEETPDIGRDEFDALRMSKVVDLELSCQGYVDEDDDLKVGDLLWRQVSFEDRDGYVAVEFGESRERRGCSGLTDVALA